MRLAYVCADPGVPVFGRKGCSIHVQEVLRALRRRGVGVDLFAARLDGEPPPSLASVRLHNLPAPPKGDPAARERAALLANGDLGAALERSGPFDLVYERYSLWSAAAMEYARDNGVPGLLEVNAPLIEEQARHRDLVDRAGAERVAARAFGAASALIAVSDGVASYLDGWPEARGRVHVVPNGVDPERFRPDVPPALPRAPGSFVIGFVGTLKPWHGLPTLVEAFARLRPEAPGASLIIVGDGPERSDLEAELAARGVSGAVRLTGAVDPAAVPGLLTAMDVAVAPYPQLPDFYFSPLKVYEYMAAGRTVVASRIGQLADLIQHDVNGLLVPPGDPAALAEALGQLRRRPAWRARLGEAARATVLRERTWDAVAGRILSLAGRRAGAAVDARP
jgi:glycosyltransferase involved in cell wall biosynthesis